MTSIDSSYLSADDVINNHTLTKPARSRMNLAWKSAGFRGTLGLGGPEGGGNMKRIPFGLSNYERGSRVLSSKATYSSTPETGKKGPLHEQVYRCTSFRRQLSVRFLRSLKPPSNITWKAN